MNVEALLDELVERVATRVAEKLREPDDQAIPLSAAGVPVRTLRKAIKRCELEASKVGRDYLVKRADLNAWIAGRRVERKPEAETPAQRAIARAASEGRLRVVGERR